MSICELVWKDGTACNGNAVKRVKITMHSRIYAGLQEVNNEYRYYDVCEAHHKLVKNEKDVTTL